MRAKLPAGTGRVAVLYEDSSPTDPREGARLPWAREPNGMVESDLQPQNLAKAQGAAPDARYPGGAFFNESGSMYSVVSTPERNNSVYPIWGRDYDPRDRRGSEIVGWQVATTQAPATLPLSAPLSLSLYASLLVPPCSPSPLLAILPSSRSLTLPPAPASHSGTMLAGRHEDLVTMPDFSTAVSQLRCGTATPTLRSAAAAQKASAE